MLLYFAQGRRDYRRKPLRPHTRQGWEFQVVLSGRIAWTNDAGIGEPGLSRRRLWVFGPGCRHGWTGESRPARVAVWHFGSVDAALASWVGAEGWTDAALDTSQLDEASVLARETALHWPRTTNRTAVVSDLAKASLTLMAMSGLPVLRTGRSGGGSEEATRTAMRAVAWFKEHADAGPSVAEVASAVAVSESHLRRLFRAAGQPSPGRVFNALRIDRADELLRTTGWKLSVVAESVGFSGAEAFSRAYRSVRGTSPGRARRQAR